MRLRQLLVTSNGMLAIVLLFLPENALACAACFGRSDSPMAKGMNLGIFALLVVIVSVLSAIATFFVYISRRSARVEAIQSSAGASPATSNEPAVTSNSH